MAPSCFVPVSCLFLLAPSVLVCNLSFSLVYTCPCSLCHVRVSLLRPSVCVLVCHLSSSPLYTCPCLCRSGCFTMSFLPFFASCPFFLSHGVLPTSRSQSHLIPLRFCCCPPVFFKLAAPNAMVPEQPLLGTEIVQAAADPQPARSQRSLPPLGPPQGPVGTSSGMLYQVWSDYGWKDQAPAVCEAWERNRQNGIMQFYFQMCGYLYIINLQDMVQTRSDTGVSRMIRRLQLCLPVSPGTRWV